MAEDKSGDPDLKETGQGHTRSTCATAASGWQMAVYIVGGILLGRWLDGLIGWKFPVLTLALLFLGISGAFWILFKEARKQRQ
jgi:predicted MFS family arabinose efflux permease